MWLEIMRWVTRPFGLWCSGIASVLLLVVVLAHQMMHVSIGDPTTVDELIIRLRKEFLRTHPGVTLISKLPKPLESARASSLSWMDDIPAGALAHLPEAMTSATTELQPWIEFLDKCADQHQVFGPFDSSGCQGYSEAVCASQLLGARAQQVALYGDWPGGLKELDQAAHMGDALRWNCRAMSTEYFMQRLTIYQIARGLCFHQPPPAVLAELRKRLVALRETDPQIDQWQGCTNLTWMPDIWRAPGDGFETGGSLMRGMFRDTLQKQGMVNNAAMQIARQQARFHDPELAREGLLYWSGASLGGYSSIPYNPLQMNQMKGWLRCVVASESWSWQRFPLPETEYRNLDPWTLAIAAGFMESKFSDKTMYCWRTIAQRRLLEAMVAARLEFVKTGKWPETSEGLAALVVPEAATTTETLAFWKTQVAGIPDPVQPLQIGRKSMRNGNLRNELWGQAEPYVGEKRNCYKEVKKIDAPTSFTRVVTLRESWARFLPETLQVARQIAEKPGLVKEVRVDIQMYRTTETQKLIEKAEVSDNFLTANEARQAMPSSPPNAGHLAKTEPRGTICWYMLTPEMARELAAQMQRKAVESESGLPRMMPGMMPGMPGMMPGMMPSGRFGNGTEWMFSRTPGVCGLRMVIELKAPEEAVVIWGAGPDGVDDRAEIVYDPTNGTLSRGDVVIFPEEF